MLKPNCRNKATVSGQFSITSNTLVRRPIATRACPVDCIHPKKDEGDFEGPPQLYIDPRECIDCGACVPVCPVSAIFALDDLPIQWSQFAQINQEHYRKAPAH